MSGLRNSNDYDKALLLLFASMFSGNMGGILLLPRTMSILLIPLVLKGACVKNEWTTFLAPIKNLFVFWLLWGGLSLLWSPDIYLGCTEFVLLLFNILFAYEIVIFSCRSNKPLLYISWGWLLALSINNFVGVWEIITDNHLSVSKFGSDREIVIEGAYVFMRYANGFFSNYNAFVAFICCALPFLYYLFFTTYGKIIKLFVVADLIVSIFILFMDASRGGLIALVIISFIFLLKLLRGRNSRGITFLLFSMIILLVAYFWEELSFMVIGRQMNVSGFEDEPRAEIWMNCFKSFGDYYGIGTGTGGIDASMAKYAGSDGTLAPHNAFLELLVQYGFVVFILFVILIIKTYKNAKKNTDMFAKTMVYASLVGMPFIFIINSLYLKNPFFWAFFISLYVFAWYNRHPVGQCK